MAYRRNSDDIFKKLNREKPLVRQKNAGVSSSRKSSYDSSQEKKREDLRHTLQSGIQPETRMSRRSRKTQKSAVKQAKQMAAGYQERSKRTNRSGEKSELDIFAQKTRAKTKVRMPKEYDAVKTQPVNTQAELQSPIPEIRQQAQQSMQVQKPARPRQMQEAMPYNDNVRQKAVKEKPFLGVQAIQESKALSFRHELKYYINYRDYIILRNALKAMMSPDAYSQSNNSYHIRSLYFDDMDDSALKDKVAGSDDRYKYRIRIYNFSDDVIRFEKKIKKGQFIAKKGILLSRGEYEKIVAGDYDFLLGRKENFAREIFLQLRTRQLSPRVLVDYTREAYVSPFENVRITFDKDLKGSLTLKDIFDEKVPVMPMYDNGIMVLEVKFNGYLPHHIKCVLNGINASDRGAISKYVICRKFD